MDKRLYFHLFLCAMVVVSLSGCSPNAMEIIGDKTCEAPCWRNITPGEDSIPVLPDYIQKFNDVKRDSIKTWPVYDRYSDSGITFDFTNDDTGELYFRGPTPLFMKFNFSGYIPLFEAINKYGAPDQVRATKAVLDGVWVKLDLLFLQKGVCIELKPSLFVSPKRGSIHISGLTPVQSIEYFDPSVSAEQISSPCYYPLEEAKIQDWHGYASYTLFDQ